MDLNMNNFNVVFSGNIAPNHTINNVKNNLNKLFKLNDAKIEQMFNGYDYNLKTNLDQEAAENFKEKLEKIGVLCEIKECFPEDNSSKESGTSDLNESIQKNMTTDESDINKKGTYSIVNYTLMLIVRSLFIFFPINYLPEIPFFIPLGLTIVIVGVIIGVVFDVLFPSSVIGGRLVAKAFNTGTLCWFKGIDLRIKIDTTGKGVAVKDLCTRQNF